MTNDALLAAQRLMQEAGVRASAINTFSHYFEQVASGATGLVRESDIEPVTDLPRLADVNIDESVGRAALAQSVIIKLNGGLGTSMGLAGPKSLLPVRDGLTFLDITARQVLAARAQYDVQLPLIWMNSFATRSQTLAALEAYPELVVDDLPMTFEQSQEPKLLVGSLMPAEWPADPSLVWAPPGHGDIYPSLLDSGLLDALLEHGFRYAAVSNSDNLGAAPSAELAGWFAASGAPFAMEVCRRTQQDRKGGHLARRRVDDQLILRETAQTAPADRVAFEDEQLHRYFNTNSLWLDLGQLRDLLLASDGVLGLPLIVNEKHVDPTDLSSPRVIQIEAAMGAAIEVFDGATAIEIGRDRFMPVKKTNDLLLLRSDLFDLDDSYRLVATTPKLPAIDLDQTYFQFLADFESRVPAPLSLREATSLTVRGDVRFEERVSVIGDVIIDAETPRVVGAGAILQ